jgi:hypothetical protein
MTSVITRGAVTITPDEIEGYESRRESGNKSHPILGSEDIDITHRPARRRAGTITLLFASESDSKAAEDEHASGGITPFVLANAETSTIGMAYSVLGGVGRSFSGTDGFWRVTVDYQEVAL